MEAPPSVAREKILGLCRNVVLLDGVSREGFLFVCANEDRGACRIVPAPAILCKTWIKETRG
jgi:hypothetical protein